MIIHIINLTPSLTLSKLKRGHNPRDPENLPQTFLLILLILLQLPIIQRHRTRLPQKQIPHRAHPRLRPHKQRQQQIRLRLHRLLRAGRAIRLPERGLAARSPDRVEAVEDPSLES